jgi:hypothetical protein
VISGHVIKPKVGWYTRPSVDGDKNWRAAETNRKEFWLPILEETDFPKWVQERYTLGMTEMVQEEDE